MDTIVQELRRREPAFHQAELCATRERVSRRMSAWRRVEGEWRILYHQGTLVAGA